MSTVVVFAPVMAAAWPVIAAAVTAAARTGGYTLSLRREGRNRAAGATRSLTEVEVEAGDILEQTTADGQMIALERDGVRAEFRRDGRGKLKLCLNGSGHSRHELHRIGEELLGVVTQQYAYHRIVTEMKHRNMVIVDEDIAADRTVRIRVRSL